MPPQYKAQFSLLDVEAVVKLPAASSFSQKTVALGKINVGCEVRMDTLIRRFEQTTESGARRCVSKTKSAMLYLLSGP